MAAELWFIRVIYPFCGLLSDFAVTLFILLATLAAAKKRRRPFLNWLIPLLAGDILQSLAYTAILSVRYVGLGFLSVYTALYALMLVAGVLVIYGAARMWTMIKNETYLNGLINAGSAPPAWPPAPDV